MPSKLRLFTRKFFVIANIVVVLFFLLACLAPYLNPQHWWFVSFLGLAFPFILLFVVIFLGVWLALLKWRTALISGIALLIGIKSISLFLAFHKPSKFSYAKTPGTLRVVSWNVARFIELKKNNNKGSETRQKMLDLLQQQDADVLCLQEFHTAANTRPDFYENITPIQQMGFKHYYFSFDLDGDGLFYSSIIFSKYPIVDSGIVRYPRPTLPDVLLSADINFNGQRVRVFTTHLQSFQFGRQDYERLNKIKEGEEGFVSNSKSILSKMRRGVTYRSVQAETAHDVMKLSPHPVIFCGDLNDVPNSYTYHTMRGNMQDAFLKKGFGIGRTFSALSPTLRIDYIFAGKEFKVKQFSRIAKRLSDHYMIVADVELRNQAK